MRHCPIISGAKVNVRRISGIEENVMRARRQTQRGLEHANGLQGHPCQRCDPSQSEDGWVDLLRMGRRRRLRLREKACS